MPPVVPMPPAMVAYQPGKPVLAPTGMPMTVLYVSRWLPIARPIGIARTVAVLLLAANTLANSKIHTEGTNR
jgi:hypothetical protein